MRTGIITTHYSINFGAILQAYALFRAINNLNHDCEVIDYRPNKSVYGRNVNYKFDSIKNLVYSALRMLNISYRKKKREKIRRFDKYIIENFDLSQMIYKSYVEMKKKLPEYDNLVCGSDQIWNLNLFNDPAFFLRFEDIHPDTNFIAYGPSVAEDLSSNQIQKIIENIKHFDYLSLREKRTSEMIGDMLTKEIECVLDPVFLMDSSDWKQVEEPLDINSSYILNYGLTSGGGYIEALNYIREKLQYKLVDINVRPFNKFNSEYSFTDLSPGNFVWLFRNAEFIYTSSFHGTVFSILFEKQFVANPSSLRSLRIDNILDLVGMRERKIEKDNAINSIDLLNTDYKIPLKKLSELKRHSYNYLSESLDH